jgi:hypothetical protein
MLQNQAIEKSRQDLEEFDPVCEKPQCVRIARWQERI